MKWKMRFLIGLFFVAALFIAEAIFLFVKAPDFRLWWQLFQSLVIIPVSMAIPTFVIGFWAAGPFSNSSLTRVSRMLRVIGISLLIYGLFYWVAYILFVLHVPGVITPPQSAVPIDPTSSLGVFLNYVIYQGAWFALELACFQSVVLILPTYLLLSLVTRFLTGRKLPHTQEGQLSKES